MAKIIEDGLTKRRMIRMSTDDVINVVREYQNRVKIRSCYEDIRSQLEDCIIFIPEDL